MKKKWGTGKKTNKQPWLGESGPPIVIPKKPIEHITIYGDGACQPNPGTGGYGFVVVDKDEMMYEFCRKVEDTTNNRMEMSAIQDALQWVAIECPDEKVVIYTDSEYCHKGITKWHHGWISKGWVDVKNSDLWKELTALKNQCPKVEYQWVKAHNGNKWNEWADRLAVSAITGKREEDKPVKKPGRKHSFNCKTLHDIDTGASSGWVQDAEDRKLKRDIATEVPDALLLAVYREIWRDKIFMECSHGLVANITEYLQSKSLIPKPIEHEIRDNKEDNSQSDS